jgi:hypothetical protein
MTSIGYILNDKVKNLNTNSAPEAHQPMAEMSND